MSTICSSQQPIHSGYFAEQLLRALVGRVFINCSHASAAAAMETQPVLERFFCNIQKYIS